MTGEGEEAELVQAMAAAGLGPAAPRSAFDFASEDGSFVVEVKSSTRGVRGLHAALMQLALAVERQPTIRNAVFVALGHGMSEDRIIEEWAAACEVLRPGISKRIGLIALSERGVTVLPDKRQELSYLANCLKNWAGPARQPAKRPEVHYIIMKILLIRWLLDKGPLMSKELGELVGCTFPTVAVSLKRLGSNLLRHSDRKVELKSFPRAQWEELVALSARVRRPVRFVDASGESPDPSDLLRRLERLRVRGVGVGGVVAARYWDPQFDLHGTPRLDLSIHSPKGEPDLEFVRKLDPALQASDDPGAPVTLVVHRVFRFEDLFVAQPGSALRWADPVETLLDLHELRLERQADEMVGRLVAGRAGE